MRNRSYAASPENANTYGLIAQAVCEGAFSCGFDAAGETDLELFFDIKTLEKYLKLSIVINAAIINADKQGLHTFLCGMERGFDLLCAQTVLELRQSKEYSHIKLIAVQPYIGHSFSDEWGEIHKEVINAADGIMFTSMKASTTECYQVCNKYMIDNSSRLICFCNEQESGTSQTILMAKEHGHSVDNLYKLWSESL